MKVDKRKLWLDRAFLRNTFIAVCILIAFLAAFFVLRPEKKKEKYDLFNIDRISELTTLQCRYHNVSIYDYDGGLFGSTSVYVWFEYDVILDIGIDINQVWIDEPTDNGVIKVYLPPAKILGAVVDKETISKPVCDIAVFAELTADEERQIVNEGVRKLQEDAKTQEVIVFAYNSARDVLEQYIINIGNMMGEEYSVEWVTSSPDVQTETSESSALTE